ncbi:MAG TPA: hypothetical protein PKM27_04410 [Saprospiraceae bacterium]|nr:hypothetical protein [Saprospiraceae bacterium]HNT21113.1 hypothetical protein [Saprospiraceae bacterium]
MISGFTFLRNAGALYYPYVESILSILPLVDEFIVVLGEGDPGDRTREKLDELRSPKLKILDSVWDTGRYRGGSIYAQQTDLAKAACRGDWLFYLQGDEVIHEEDHALIRQACEAYIQDPRVEGFVFDFLHFYGDYRHYFRDHCWYKKEIRIIRNLPGIHSWRDAQSFRYIPDFKDPDYFRTEGTRKLNCIALSARVFHYGWVRPPDRMALKNAEAGKNYQKPGYEKFQGRFDYGRLDRARVYDGKHPSVMNDWMTQLNWQDLLRFSGPAALNRPLMKHEKLRYRILHSIEERILGGRVIGGFRNYHLLQAEQ